MSRENEFLKNSLDQLARANDDRVAELKKSKEDVDKSLSDASYGRVAHVNLYEASMLADYRLENYKSVDDLLKGLDSLDKVRSVISNMENTIPNLESSIKSVQSKLEEARIFTLDYIETEVILQKLRFNKFLHESIREDLKRVIDEVEKKVKEDTEALDRVEKVKKSFKEKEEIS